VTSAEGQPPLLRVVHGGEPTAEELAALVAAVTAATAVGDAPPRSGRPGRWADRGSLLRQPLVAGRGAWVRSARP
jgi:hypothetical protein